MTRRGYWESQYADVVDDELILSAQFSAVRSITRVRASDGRNLGSVGRVGYRSRVKLPDDNLVIEVRP
jgi:hypothetical protein